MINPCSSRAMPITNSSDRKSTMITDHLKILATAVVESQVVSSFFILPIGSGLIDPINLFKFNTAW